MTNGRDRATRDEPSRRVSLPNVEIRPPAFLGPREAMADVYTRSHPRTARRTATLLASDELDALLALVSGIATSTTLSRRPQARLSQKMLDVLGRDTGPFLTGFDDARLVEPWRLFLEGWELWDLTEGDTRSLELYWEGEFANDAGDTVEMLESLALIGGELRLCARIGEVADEIWFDGTTIYRPRHGAP